MEAMQVFLTRSLCAALSFQWRQDSLQAVRHAFNALQAWIVNVSLVLIGQVGLPMLYAGRDNRRRLSRVVPKKSRAKLDFIRDYLVISSKIAYLG
ncbi:hypothetical protein [Undibacterium oligocarboniphilum]|uniref:Uncharacterized protein n=1 Tax=Undibacterium oligocarboniphilum TaxID=666702 RepID=A0A850QGU4_9BURK|nr:hypothetical protein [Undibacterium oligocarboniphilum]MBC3868675.1 hypothetical protein [Undibacterium oligocarboniphilum]NVO76655.1 hypothetical protein [Undibacterium oligocarboniphilum]